MRPRITEDAGSTTTTPRRKPGKKPITRTPRPGQDGGNATVTEIFPNQAAALLDGGCLPLRLQDTLA